MQQTQVRRSRHRRPADEVIVADVAPGSGNAAGDASRGAGELLERIDALLG